ncbi:TraB/GumN family protein [Candidatus Uabimicrobium amorphum]|uniref:Conjugal transfer protein TraB n=1 Tax=Uabimicrobium amorphum TaxID=2596890 RepID=A0A5S9IQB6_UABAM|nr:TraB/GumN family protein [Candidatus Uabimicrobium amorphum]BBM86119.1 conjugal transfer protein TraB [Candidatus Uabimicrobium amorphum]
MTNDTKLPDSITHVTLGDRDIYLLGTAHVSKESVEDVHQSVEQLSPDTICVELCDARFKTLRNPENWKNMDVFQIIKEKKALLLLAQLVMTSFYKQIGEELGVKPGAEMMAGCDLADEHKITLVLADRDIQITMKRVWGNLRFRDKLKIMTQMGASLFVSETIDEKTINEMKEKGNIENVLEAFSKEFPTIKRVLIDERDIYLSQKIRNCEGDKVVAVVGAGHVPGITKKIQEDIALDPYREIPKTSWATTFAKWFIPLAIIGVFIYFFTYADTEKFKDAVYIWVVVNGVLSAIGAAIALGHPLTIISAFVAAPLTSLNPLIAAGWVSGLVQAWLKRPTVADLESLPQDISSAKGFWKNSASRILLVVVFSNIGSAIGSLVAFPWILSTFFK